MAGGPAPDRRALIGGLAAAVAAAPTLTFAEAAPGQAGTRLVILGSRGGPVVGSARYQTSHAVLVGDATYVVDCGYGATEQLVRAKIRLDSIRDIFITHHHPDHNIELGTLIYFAWFGGLQRPLGVYGPPPLARILHAYLEAEQPDVDVWLKDIGHMPMAPVTAHELASAGPVMQDDQIKVTCAVVNHPPVVPALAYRFDTPGRSIVFSGDTTPVEAVANLAKGADVLVHEAIYPEAFDGPRDEQGSPIAGDADLLRKHVLGAHTSAVEAGRIAAEAGVKTLVLSHLVPVDGSVTDEMWRAAAAQHFKGEIIVAHDLMVI